MEWRIKQEGLVVAEGSADDAEFAKHEAAHYSIMYAQDGPPVDMFYREAGKWRKVTTVEFCHSPDRSPKGEKPQALSS